MTGTLVQRRLAGRTLGDATLIDAVERVEDGTRLLTLFFLGSARPDRIIAPEGAELRAASSIGGAPLITYALPADAALSFEIAGDRQLLVPAEAEHELMDGANVLAAVRNGERADTVLDWLKFHEDHHGLTGAVILDRAEPGTDPDFAKALAAGLETRGLVSNVVLLSSDLPLGKPDLPAEVHPFNVPEAPGKDRMEVPLPAPWDSPLGAMTIYELMRARFLARARAVANLDVHDLAIRGAQSIFDAANTAEGGLVELLGRHCYPWRVRDVDDVRFADHICVQFDASGARKRWCLAPAKLPANAVWRLVLVGNARPDPALTQGFYRHMALRHPTPSISRIVPKTSLVEQPALIHQAEDTFGHAPVRMPERTLEVQDDGPRRCAIVTTMKNEGPFILEWLAYHRAIGFDDIIVYTNDCTDGTDTMLKLLQDKGIVQHRENPFREMGLKPQHAALQAAEGEDLIRNATWVTCIDVDEYVNIKTGDGTLEALFAAVPDANMIAMTWRLFGNADIHEYVDRPIIEQFFTCAPELCRKPHQAWGFKTLFRNLGLFKKLGVHRPKGLNPQLWKEINWVNGSGKPLPPEMYRNAWRSTSSTYGYDLVQLNHYAVRSAESFLVKRDRGRVNHVDRDQGLAYWFRMNNNGDEDRSILRNVPLMRAELERLMADPDIAAAHAHSVDCHRAKIDALRETQAYSKFYGELTGARLQRLSRLHAHFGANVFLAGPEVVPNEVLDRDATENWFFTVEDVGATQH